MKNSTNTCKINPKIKSIRLLISMFSVLLLLFSCSSDDNGSDTSINVQNPIVFTADENLQSGQSIGTITATSSSPVTFTISEQVFTNAIVINPSTGELAVGDASFFDFETNPIIEGVIEISNGIESVSTDLRIDLNNKDDIAFSLTESKQDYIDAAIGDWIEITEAEYDNLNTVLQDVKKSGFFEIGVVVTPSINSVFTLSNLNEVNTNSMPNSSLVFAFKYFAVETQLNSDRHRVKQSSVSNNTGFENIGNPLPSHQKLNGAACFVLKGSETMISSNEGFLGFQKSSGSTMGITNSGRLLFSLGEASDLIMESNGSNALYEGLSTSRRQWD